MTSLVSTKNEKKSNLQGIDAHVTYINVRSSLLQLSSVVTAVCKFGNLLYARSFLPLRPDWKYCCKYLETATLNFTNSICTVIFASGT